MSKTKNGLTVAPMTRRKVAQLNTRQLRRKDASMKKIAEITQMLRRPAARDKSESPGKNDRSSSKSEKSPSKNTSPKQMKTYKGLKNKECLKTRQKTPVQEIYIQKSRTSEKPKKTNEGEYYPNKMKRNVKANKVVLKPKHGVKIGSKRKVAMPQKGVKSPSPKRTKYTHDTSTVQDIIELYEKQGLSDEDFLEILTCDSPVWWEDPPDHNYEEDAILRMKPDHQFKEKSPNINQSVQSTKTEGTTNKLPDVKQSDNKFMKKRSKLENLLGNIKNKLTNKGNIITINNNKHTNSKIIENKNTPKNKDTEYQTNINMVTKQTSLGSSGRTTDGVKRKYEKTNEDQTNIQSRITVDDSIKTNENLEVGNIGRIKRIQKTTSESTEGDDPFLTLRDSDILNDLENMEIPMRENDTYITSNQIVNSDVKDNSNNSPKITEELASNGSKEDQSTSGILGTHNNSIKSESLNQICTNSSVNVENKNTILIDAESKTTKRADNKNVFDNKKILLQTNSSDVVTHNKNPMVNTEDNFQNEELAIQKLTITSIEKISSPSLSDVDNSSSVEFDTISESNIKFIDEDASSVNSEYSSSDSKNFSEKKCEIKGVDTCRENLESYSTLDEKNETTKIQNEKDFESVEKITKFKNQKKKDKEYMTVYKIISCEDVADDQIVIIKNVANDKDLQNIEKSDVLKKLISENDKGNEKTDTVKGNLNSFYKKCKNTYHRKHKSTSSSSGSDINKNITIEEQNSIENKDKNNEHSISSEVEVDNTLKKQKVIINRDQETDSVCRSCETSEKSIVIPDQNVVKYCLKCSSIFESENCTYCNKKVEMDKKNQHNINRNSENMKQCNANGEVKFSCSVCTLIFDNKDRILKHFCGNTSVQS